MIPNKTEKMTRSAWRKKSRTEVDSTNRSARTALISPLPTGTRIGQGEYRADRSGLFPMIEHRRNPKTAARYGSALARRVGGCWVLMRGQGEGGYILANHPRREA